MLGLVLQPIANDLKTVLRVMKAKGVRRILALSTPSFYVHPEIVSAYLLFYEPQPITPPSYPVAPPLYVHVPIHSAHVRASGQCGDGSHRHGRRSRGRARLDDI